MLGGGGTDSSIASGSTTRFLGMYLDAVSTTESQVQQIAPVGGTLSQFTVRVVTTPSAGTSWTFTVRLAGANTAVTCNIPNGSTSCTDSTHSVAVSAGALISIGVVPTGSPTSASGITRWVAQLQ